MYIPKQSQTMHIFFGKLFFFYLHTTVLCMCTGGVSFHLTHHHSSKCSSSCRQWCNSSSYLLLTHHHPHMSSHLTHPYSAYFIVTTSFIHTKPPTPNSWCVFMLLITTLSFPFSLHMPLITTFSSGLWLCWSLITTFLLVQWVGRKFGRKIFWGNNYVIQASELHGC